MSETTFEVENAVLDTLLLLVIKEQNFIESDLEKFEIKGGKQYYEIHQNDDTWMQLTCESKKNQDGIISYDVTLYDMQVDEKEADSWKQVLLKVYHANAKGEILKS